MYELLKPTGNYKKLLTYQKANVIYCLTYYFVENYIKKSDRTYDQMLQAARSGKQNIVEGAMAGATSNKTEIKLINVAKASFSELLEDFEDFLKTREKRQWEPDSEEMIAMRNIGKSHNGDTDYFMKLAKTRPPETIANMSIVLIKQIDYMLFKQLKKLCDDFTQNGGFTERMYKIRKQQQREENKEQ